MKTTTLNHACYSSRPSFASAVSAAFPDAAILPSSEVMDACLRAGGKKSKDVELAMLANSLGTTAYRVGGEFGMLYVLSADDGTAEVYDLGDSDEEAETECAAVLASLAEMDSDADATLAD